MNENLKIYMVQENTSILNALKTINQNTKGFIGGASASDSIENYIVRKFTSLCVKNDISDAIKLFKNKAIKFLPIQIEKSIINVTCGSFLFIPMGAKHRLTNTDEHENLIITEVQIGDYLGEDDIVRYEDIYGRTK